MLDIRGMARSTYYYHEARLESVDKYASLRHRIDKIYKEHRSRYGYRRITMQLKNEGIVVNHKTVLKLMSEMGLKADKRKRKYRSYKGETGKIAPNMLNRDFSTTRPNQKWATDVTEVKIKGRKLYLSPILDMFNGEIVSYSISYHPDMKMISCMLNKAFHKFDNLKGLILHSDQGWQYQHVIYQDMLKDRDITQSMSRKGNCLDNSMMENFFGLMKKELLYLRKWDDIDQFARELVKYIRYYNEQRIKLRLNGKSPVQARALFLAHNLVS